MLNDISRCFGIGCPLRDKCARASETRVKKEGPFVLEQYDFVAGRCANQIERDVEVADEDDI